MIEFELRRAQTEVPCYANIEDMCLTPTMTPGSGRSHPFTIARRQVSTFHDSQARTRESQDAPPWSMYADR
jgi:hypothetical protein